MEIPSNLFIRTFIIDNMQVAFWIEVDDIHPIIHVVSVIEDQPTTYPYRICDSLEQARTHLINLTNRDAEEFVQSCKLHLQNTRHGNTES